MIGQACWVDTDCPDGQVCVDGQCVSEGGGNGETGGGTNWLLVGGGIALAILTVLLLKKK